MPGTPRASAPRTRVPGTSPSVNGASAAMMSGAEQIATSATTAIPASVTAVKYAAWYPAMHAPAARARHTSAPRGPCEAGAPRGAPLRSAASTSRTAAIQRRAVPTSSGLTAYPLTTIITEPVVPQEIAARPIRRTPSVTAGA